MFSFPNIIKFDCNGNWRKSGHDFDPKGFLRSYGSTVICDFENGNSEIILFGKKYEFWSALETDSDWLFNMSRKFLMQLRDSEINVPKPYEKNISRQDAVQFMSMTAQYLRSDVSVFLYYIDYYLRVCQHNSEKCNLTIDKASAVESIVDGLRMIIHQFDRYFFSEQFLVQCSSPDEKFLCNPAYQLVHCCLDFRWFYILIKYKLKNLKNILNHDLSPEANDSENNTYLLLMSELVITSVVKFKFLEHSNLIEEILICPCIKEIWVLIFKHLGIESFWDNFNQILRAILEIEPPPSNEILKNVCMLSSFKLKSTNSGEFTIHLLKEIAKLKEYIPCKTDYPLNADSFIPFYDNVKQYLSSDPLEKSLRTILRVTASIMNDWKLEKELVIILFLEHFHKKIHATFKVSFSECISRCTEKSGYSFLNEVKNRFLTLVEPNEHETSFGLFLRIFAVHAQRSRLEGSVMKSLYSRMHIKFDGLKQVKTYSAVTLYQTCSLFLTAAIAFGIEKEVKKLHDVMITWNYLDLSTEKKIIKWKTLVACILLLAENGYNTKDLIDHILSDVRIAVSKKEKTLIPIIVECIQVLIENRNIYMSAISIISSFTGDWIERYVTMSEVHEKGVILSVYDPLMTDLREGSDWWSEEETEDIKNQLFSYILPVVKHNVYTCSARAAAQFFSLFLRNRNWSQAYSLYTVWMQTRDSTGNVESQFIISYNEIEGDITKLGLFKRDYEIDIVKCFIKYHLLNGPTHTSHRLFGIVQSLPTTSQHASSLNHMWLPEDDNLISFIRLFGACLRNCSAKFFLKLLFNSYFSKLGEWCEVGLTSNAPKSVVNNIYHCCTRIVAECHSVIYEENHPSILTSLVDKVFLPIAKYRDYCELPLAYVEAANKHVPLFIWGLLKIYRKDYSYVKDVLRDTVNFYFPNSPKFAKINYEIHPFYYCLLDIEITREFSSILETMFLTKSYKSDNRQGENCIRLFSLISHPIARDIVFSTVIFTLLDVIMETDCSPGMLNSSLEYINKCVSESVDCRHSLKTALERIVVNESLYTGNLRNLSKLLSDVCPPEMLELADNHLENEKDDVKWQVCFLPL